MQIENTTYYGLPAQSIQNSQLRLVYLTGEGPRLVGLYLPGDERNFLAELPELGIEAPNGRYHLRGGHRLWAAPEDFSLTYLPDDQPPQVESLPYGVRLTELPHPLSGLRKCIELHLNPFQPVVEVIHTIENCCHASLELAAWAITQMPLGGVAVLPQHTHFLDPSGLLPNRLLSLWPYTNLQDERLCLTGSAWKVHASGGPRAKIGYLNLAGWIAYLNGGRVFVKRFEPPQKLAHTQLPDLGVNTEVYTDDHFLELETLGPLMTLLPGQAVQLTEIWEVYASPEAVGLDPQVAALL